MANIQNLEIKAEDIESWAEYVQISPQKFRDWLEKKMYGILKPLAKDCAEELAIEEY